MTDASTSQRVFIIHGRNTNAVKELSRFLRALGLEPWPFETVSAKLGANPYVGEVVEVGIQQARLVIAMFTPDERAVLQRSFYQSTDKEHDRRRSQSRPNVFFETGMALALAPDKTLMVVAGDVELPSDFGGKLLLRLSNSAGPRQHLREVIERMGCQVNRSDDFLDAKNHGDFDDNALFGKETPQLPSPDSKKVDLLLGPAGVRSIAFAGAIAALQHNGYTIERIFGISGGALVAASFAASNDAQVLIERICEGGFLQDIRPPSALELLKALRHPFATQKALPATLCQNALGSDPTFDALRIPLGIAALDISKGRMLAYTSERHPKMKVSDALAASTAVPLFYPWVSAGDRIIVDAAIQTQCPLWLLAAFSKPTGNRAVFLSATLPQFQPPADFGEYLWRLFEASALAGDHLGVLQSRRLIRIPIAVTTHGSFDRLDPSKRKELIQQGGDAIDKAIESSLFRLPDAPPRVAQQGQRDPHDLAETEASNAAIRYARELQRFSSELEDE